MRRWINSTMYYNYWNILSWGGDHVRGLVIVGIQVWISVVDYIEIEIKAVLIFYLCELPPSKMLGP